MAEVPAEHRRTLPLRLVALVAACVLASMAVRATVEHVRAYEKAVQWEKEGELDRAVSEYRWALRWYTPWGPWHEDAAAALWDIGQRLEAEHPMRAVAAYDALRSGLIASRSLWQPQAAMLAKVNSAIPPLLVRAAERRLDKRDPKALLRRFQADYQRRVGVPAWASAGVGLGFLLWVGGLLFAFSRGVDDKGHLVGRGWRGLGVSLLGFLCWATAMWLA